MKTPSVRPASFKKSLLSKGFSLIEILVVVFIIALLLTFLIPAIGGQMSKAKRDLSVTTQISTLQAAVDGYFDEYGDYPLSWVEDATKDTEHLTLRTTAAVMAPLVGETEAGENPRDISFFSADDFEKNKGGFVQRGDSFDLLSPWAADKNDSYHHYVIRIDVDYDDEIEHLTSKGKKVRNRRVLIMAAGEDGKLGTEEGEEKSLAIDNAANFKIF